jgi:alginate O-acetyltransferase complex protein AlgJ
MSNLEQPLPAGGQSREAVALREVGHTAVTPVTVRILLASFLIAIGVVSIVESPRVGALIQSRLTAGDRTNDRRPELQLGRYVREGGQLGRLWRRVVSANRSVLAGVNSFERALEDQSILGRSLRPRAQALMAGWLGAGNERVYAGRQGWLFYRQDVEYVTGRGFLDPAQLRRRVAAAAEWDAPPQPDPREAIVPFKRDLEARGITLIVMPTPLKPGIHPEMLARGYAGTDGGLQNPSYRAFVEALERDGVWVFDPSEALAAARRTAAQYLSTDSHWRPETMEMAVERLGSFIVANVPLPVTSDPDYRIERSEVRNTGDLARMLDLRGDSPLFPPEAVWLRRVIQSDGRPWRSSRDADVLVLGDSFSNIYALESMGWGTSAGFAEQLAYTLRRPVDRLVQNDEGAFATRAMLQREPGRLDGKRVVVYQFAARELAFGDWKLIPMPGR